MLAGTEFRCSCGSSSFGRARPCQGRGGRFEPGLPLQIIPTRRDFFSLPHSGGGTGRHAGLKILKSVMAVRVQVPPEVQKAQLTLGFSVYF